MQGEYSRLLRKRGTVAGLTVTDLGKTDTTWRKPAGFSDDVNDFGVDGDDLCVDV
jgi:hypothetical protein